MKHEVEVTLEGEFWRYEGKLHRLGGLPAVKWADGREEYYENGERHRAGGLPAIKDPNGHEVYWENGKLHRAGGLPAIKDTDGYEAYWENGKRHRLGGLPAIKCPNGYEEYWENGVKITKKKALKRAASPPSVPKYTMTKLQEMLGHTFKIVKERPHLQNRKRINMKNINYEVDITLEGGEFWRYEGKLHRLGGLPAIKWANGREEYWENGERHRSGGLPAVKCPNGYEEYWENNKRHRVGGLPAIKFASSHEEYWENGKRHRAGGLPAIKYTDGRKEYWENGIKITKKEALKRAASLVPKYTMAQLQKLLGHTFKIVKE